MFEKIGLWFLRKSLKTKINIERSSFNRVHFGPLMIQSAPEDFSKFTHDAVKAFSCDGFIFMFYKDVIEWKP